MPVHRCRRAIGASDRQQSNWVWDDIEKSAEGLNSFPGLSQEFAGPAGPGRDVPARWHKTRPC